VKTQPPSTFGGGGNNNVCFTCFTLLACTPMFVLRSITFARGICMQCCRNSLYIVRTHYGTKVIVEELWKLSCSVINRTGTWLPRLQRHCTPTLFPMGIVLWLPLAKSRLIHLLMVAVGESKYLQWRGISPLIHGIFNVNQNHILTHCS